MCTHPVIKRFVTVVCLAVWLLMPFSPWSHFMPSEVFANDGAVVLQPVPQNQTFYDDPMSHSQVIEYGNFQTLESPNSDDHRCIQPSFAGPRQTYNVRRYSGEIIHSSLNDHATGLVFAPSYSKQQTSSLYPLASISGAARHIYPSSKFRSATAGFGIIYNQSPVGINVLPHATISGPAPKLANPLVPVPVSQTPETNSFAIESPIPPPTSPVPLQPTIGDSEPATPQAGTTERDMIPVPPSPPTESPAKADIDVSAKASSFVTPMPVSARERDDSSAKPPLAKTDSAPESAVTEPVTAETPGPKLSPEKPKTEAGSGSEVVDKADQSEKKPATKEKPIGKGGKPKKTAPVVTPVLVWNLPKRIRSSEPEDVEFTEITSHDRIRMDSRLGLDLTNGWVQFPVSSKGVLVGIQRSKSFLIEVNITCSDDKQHGPARILTCSKDTNARDFTLGQDGKKFTIRIRTSKSDGNGTGHETAFGRVRPGKPQRITVTYDGRNLDCYVDGELEAEREFKVDFSSWERFPVSAGNEQTADRKWSGTIHSLVVLPTADHHQLKSFSSDQ